MLHGAAVEWSVSEGALAVTPGNLGNDVRTADYAVLAGGCETRSAQPIQRRATLVARFGAFQDTITLAWLESGADPDTLAEPFEPAEHCLFGEDPGVDDDSGGCGCSSDDGAPLWGLAALPGLGLLRRRR